MFTFSQKNRNAFLKRFGADMHIQKHGTEEWLPIRGILERKLVEESSTVSFTLYVTVNSDLAEQEDLIRFEDKVYEISYLNNDLSGLVDCYLTLKGDRNGRTNKYI